jgi:hypothetical protein
MNKFFASIASEKEAHIHTTPTKTKTKHTALNMAPQKQKPER